LHSQTPHRLLRFPSRLAGAGFGILWVERGDRATKETMATRPLERYSPWTVTNDDVTLRTQRPRQVVDVTELLAERVRWSGIRHGLASVQVHHTTMGLVVNENEPLLLDDVDRMLERLVPADVRYGHDDFSQRTGVAPGERANGAAHCRSLLLAVSQTVHVVGGRLHLGRWQRVMLVELDGPQARTLSVLVMGLRHE
jgi:secondary thiamine-phosphate synthase enzyme